MFNCKNCNYSTKSKYCWGRHINSKKHINFQEKKCNICNYEGKTYFLYKQHLKTKKHKKNKEIYDKQNNSIKIDNDNTEINNNINVNNNNDTNDNTYKVIENNISNKDEQFEYMKLIIKDFMEQQKETTSKLLEIVKEPRITTNNQKTFNLNNFLNIECKDAINYSDFLNSIEVNREDLEYLQENGYTKSYENIVLRQLKEMEQTKRPLHCIDHKRKRFIIKDKNVWTKENICEKLRLSIDYFCTALIKEYNCWKDDHPEWKENPDDEIFDISMLMSNEILSPYNDRKKSSIETKVHLQLTELMINKIQQKLK